MGWGSADGAGRVCKRGGGCACTWGWTGLHVSAGQVWVSGSECAYTQRLEGRAHMGTGQWFRARTGARRGWMGAWSGRASAHEGWADVVGCWTDTCAAVSAGVCA